MVELTAKEIEDLVELINTEQEWNKRWKEYYPTLNEALGEFGDALANPHALKE